MVRSLGLLLLVGVISVACGSSSKPRPSGEGGAESSGGSGGENDGGSHHAGSPEDGGDGGSPDGAAGDGGGNDGGKSSEGGKDTGGKDSGGKDTGGKDSGGKDTGGKDSGGKNAGGKNAGGSSGGGDGGSTPEPGGAGSGGDAGGAGQGGSGGTHGDLSGCEDAGSCVSGLCSSTHDCQYCLSDSECADGRVCGSGTCADACTGEGTPCGTNGTCCNNHCVDISRDVNHCGACASTNAQAACDASEICGRSGCVPATIANLCENARATVIQGAAPNDFLAGERLGAVLAACPTPATVRTVTQMESAVVNADTTTNPNPNAFAPFIGGGEVILAAGGPFPQWVVAYLEAVARVAHVKFTTLGTEHRYERVSDGQVLVSWPASTPTHDFIIIQLIRDPRSGTPVLAAYGIESAGTAAAAWYLQNVMAPALSTYDKAYYIYEWTDAGAAGADAAAEFDLKASGP